MLIRPNPPRVVLTYGTFDLFHRDHVDLLKRLSGMGTELIVGCSTDAFLARRGKHAVMSFDQRRAVLESCRYVDRVIAQDHWDQKRTDIVNYNVSIFAVGDGAIGRFDDLQDIAEIIYIPRTRDGAPTPLNFAHGPERQRNAG